MTQLELFGPCIMGRKRKTEAERLLDCERRAAALGMRVVVLTDAQRESDLSLDFGAGPYGIKDDPGYLWPTGGMDCALLEEELAWFENQQHGDDPEPDPRPRKTLPRRAAA